MQLSFALLAVSGSLQLFGTDRDMRSREEKGGLAILPYFIVSLISIFNC